MLVQRKTISFVDDALEETRRTVSDKNRKYISSPRRRGIENEETRCPRHSSSKRDYEIEEKEQAIISLRTYRETIVS